MGDATIVLGGGLAGMTASLYCDAPVYESEDRVGGVARSETRQGFTFDYGIHILQTQNKTVLELLEDIGVKFADHNRHAFIYSHRSYTAYPFQVNTAGLPLKLRLSCLWHFFNRKHEPKPTNYKEWMYRNIGKGFADTFLIPYSEKFWGVDLREMTFEWTTGRVPKPNIWQVMRGAIWSKQTKIGTNVDFRYPITSVGYGAIAEAFYKKLPEIHLQHRAIEINTAQKNVTFENGKIVNYDTLISSLPLPKLIQLCTDVPDNVREAVSHLKTNSIMVVNIGINRPNISNKHWVHFPEKDVSFFRLSYPFNFAENVTPPGMSSISAEVSYSPASPPDKEQLIDQVIEDLIRVNALDADAPIVFKDVLTIPYAYCIYDKKRKGAIKSCHDWLKSIDIFPTGRFGQWTYYWSDEAMLSGKATAKKVLNYRCST